MLKIPTGIVLESPRPSDSKRIPIVVNPDSGRLTTVCCDISTQAPIEVRVDHASDTDALSMVRTLETMGYRRITVTILEPVKAKRKRKAKP